MAERITQTEPWAKIPHWVVMHPDLDASAIRVYAVLSKHANRDRHAFPGIRTIAAEAHCAKSTVQVSLDKLEELGAIIVTRSHHGKRPKVNQYELPLSRFGVFDGLIAGTSMGRSSVHDGSVVGTSHGPTIGTEQDLKNQLTRELENENPRKPGETPVQYFQRLAGIGTSLDI